MGRLVSLFLLASLAGAQSVGTVVQTSNTSIVATAGALSCAFTGQIPPSVILNASCPLTTGSFNQSLAIPLGSSGSMTNSVDTPGGVITYQFSQLASGAMSYSITASPTGGISSGMVSGTFLIPLPPPTFSISGTISPNGAGSTVALIGPVINGTTADAAGYYTFAGIVNGTYTITPSKPGFTFTPASQPVTVNGTSVGGVNFAAQPALTPTGWTFLTSTAHGGTTASNALNTTGAAALFLVDCTVYGGAGTPTDSLHNTWVGLPQYKSPDVNGVAQIRIFYALNPLVGTSHTFSESGNSPGFFVLAFTGPTTATVGPQNGNGIFNTAPFTSGSITPTQNGSVIVTGTCANDSGFTTDLPFTVSNSLSSALYVSMGGAAAWYIQPTAGTIGATWRNSQAAGYNVAAIAAFSPGP